MQQEASAKVRLTSQNAFIPPDSSYSLANKVAHPTSILLHRTEHVLFAADTLYTHKTHIEKDNIAGAATGTMAQSTPKTIKTIKTI